MDDELFKDMQRTADHAADLIAMVSSQASLFGLEVPRLLTDASWELWMLARLPPQVKPKDVPWPRTLIPNVGVSHMDRRGFLGGVAASAGAILSEVVTTSPTPGTLARLQANIEVLRIANAEATPRRHLGSMLRQVQALDSAVKHATDGKLKRDLQVAHADALSLLGWFSNSAGMASHARAATTTAIAVAGEAGHSELAAYALGQLALFHAHHRHDPQAGLQLIESGERKVGRGRWTTRAWLAVNKAEMHSMMRDPSNTRAALDEAHLLMDGSSPSLDTPWLGEYGSLRDVWGYHGACALRLGQADEAMTALQTALDRRPPTRADYALVNLGGAYALARQPEQACTVLVDALDFIAARRSVSMFDGLLKVRPHLDPWGHEPFVRELDERIAETAAAL